ncbi:hypothetical protein GCM10023168_26380 [Fodinibacter luteus]|uniref:Class I SAM-dependent methyltransferase n=1 Tax=Fodinibacter luteus TaxID=552064 RepID=A0ABP8KLG3_9MICO
MTAAAHLASSDKMTWHRYIDFYEPHLKRLTGAQRVLEFGVFHGASLRYLAERYPAAIIVGCDILPTQDDWPRSERIDYVRVDQGDSSQLHRLFEQRPGPYDLVIDDGSHLPQHQRNCLVAALPFVRDGGVYILEDLHTSHPAHPSMSRQDRRSTNSYQLLLAFEHIQSTGGSLSDGLVDALSRRSLFTPSDVRTLFDQIDSIELYRRATLPLSCYRCGSTTFDYPQLVCSCGVRLADEADSISAVISVRHTD